MGIELDGTEGDRPPLRDRRGLPLRTAAGEPRAFDPYGIPEGRLVVDPFPADDPLDYDELSEVQMLRRVLMAVLADTGAEVVFMAARPPSPVLMAVSAGWRLAPESHPVTVYSTSPDDRRVSLSAYWLPDPRCRCAGVRGVHLRGGPGCVEAPS